MVYFRRWVIAAMATALPIVPGVASDPQSFSTKPPGTGLGLGVFIARTLSEQMGGRFRLESEPGRGTTMTVYLPRVEGRIEEPAPEPAHRLPSGSETILLAEDEDGVRHVVREVLATQGYEPLAADAAQFGKIIRDGLAKWERVVRERKIKVE